MTDNRPTPEDLVRPDPRDDDYALAALISSVIPVFGGAVSRVFDEWAASRRRQRLHEVLVGITNDVVALGMEVREEYVRSEEFGDLLDASMRRIAFERHASKRRLYRNLLLAAMTTTEEPYDEQLRFLRVIEAIQPAHIEIVRAVLQPPDKQRAKSMMTSSRIRTLKHRLPHLAEDHLKDLSSQLNDLRIFNTPSLAAMSTGDGAEDLRPLLSEFGLRFVRYVKAEETT